MVNGAVATCQQASSVGLLKPWLVLITRRSFFTPDRTCGSAIIPGNGETTEIVKTVESKGDACIF